MKQILVKGAFLVLAGALLTTPWQPAYGAGGRMAGKVTDPKGATEAAALSLSTLVLPDMATTVTPIVYAIPVQLIAYHTAVNMGTDVDQPRNLAKSVTVE